MQPLELNLSSQPFRNNTLLWVGYGLGLLLLVGFTTWNVSTWLEHRARLGSMRTSLSNIEEQLAQLERREQRALRVLAEEKYDREMLAIQAGKANDVIGWKAFSWTRLFNQLEEVLPWNVYMSAVRPLFHARRRGMTDEETEEARRSVPVTVEGFAKDLPALLEFERRLFSDPHFADPEPERHAPDDRGELVFTMRFTYYPEWDDPDGAPPDDAERAPAEDEEPEATTADGTAAEAEPAEGTAEASGPAAEPRGEDDGAAPVAADEPAGAAEPSAAAEPAAAGAPVRGESP